VPPQTVTDDQQQTADTFAFKWARRETYEAEHVKEATRTWLIERYCGGDSDTIATWLSGGGRKLILDAGCGAGFTALLLFGDRLREHDYLGVDISDAVWVARRRFQEAGIAGDFLKSDLTQLPVPDASVDLIFSEGVLHHTDNTRDAMLSLARKLAHGGRFLFYVYAKKAPIREFTDDYIRGRLSGLSDQQAWDALMPLTKLGAALGEARVTISVPEDVPLLGIKKGEFDLQRFFYWMVCKAYYRPEYSLDEMNHINFDWFRPSNCHRHTPAEVREWCLIAGLRIERMDVQDSGITVVAIRD